MIHATTARAGISGGTGILRDVGTPHPSSTSGASALVVWAMICLAWIKRDAGHWNRNFTFSEIQNCIIIKRSHEHGRVERNKTEFHFLCIRRMVHRLRKREHDHPEMRYAVFLNLYSESTAIWPRYLSKWSQNRRRGKTEQCHNIIHEPRK